ncbi:6-carboxyhexanoate--CoA ligase [Sulfoacidibacillus thermotolerans]|nr:6-carboxyhexanoate--CoA ligase [Sulfoacidibacillus thermotolerans]
MEKYSIRMRSSKIELIKGGPAPGGRVMRGAVLLDSAQCVRLEPDTERGVRVSRVDWDPATLDDWRHQVNPLGLARQRVWEALALASKVAAQPEIIAELCWSDDPSYVTGYVASPLIGYARITHLKPLGSPMGGRVFFIRTGANSEELIYRLEQQVTLVNRLPDSNKGV